MQWAQMALPGGGLGARGRCVLSRGRSAGLSDCNQQSQHSICQSCCQGGRPGHALTLHGWGVGQPSLSTAKLWVGASMTRIKGLEAGWSDAGDGGAACRTGLAGGRGGAERRCGTASHLTLSPPPAANCTPIQMPWPRETSDGQCCILLSSMGVLQVRGRDPHQAHQARGRSGTPVSATFLRPAAMQPQLRWSAKSDWMKPLAMALCTTYMGCQRFPTSWQPPNLIHKAPMWELSGAGCLVAAAAWPALSSH